MTQTPSSPRHPWVGPLALVAGVFLFITGGVWSSVLSKTGGVWVYPLDDTYIHLAMARNLVEHGVWGITPSAFTPSTSSLVWTSLLAVGGVFLGHWEQLPLVGNLVVGLMILGLVAHWLAQMTNRPAVMVGGLLAFLLATPLPTLATLGMEHLLHLLLCLLFVRVWGFRYSGGGPPRGPGWKLLLLAAVLPAVRYESLFLVAAASLIGLLDRRPRWLFLVPAGWVLIGLFGIWSMSQGWFFLPTSVLVKSALGSGLRPAGVFPWLAAFLVRASENPHLIVLLFWAGFSLINQPQGSAPSQDGEEAVEARLQAALYLLSALQHLALAETGYLFRYEGYLVGWGTVLLLRFHRHWWPRWRSVSPLSRAWVPWLGVALLVLLTTVPLALRGMKALSINVQASVNIHDQQIQMGRFVRAGEFGKGAVAVNDLGAVAWLGGRELLDVWGLAARDVAQAKRAGTFGPALVEALAAARGVTVAIVYSSWMARFGGVPRSWEKIGTWTIADNVICGDATVVFYAVGTASVPLVRRALTTFSPALPPSVRAEIFDPAEQGPGQPISGIREEPAKEEDRPVRLGTP